ncbi:MAG TPA: hypothetical protein VGM78_16620 [Ilumatobacteraceae bacterium]
MLTPPADPILAAEADQLAIWTATSTTLTYRTSNGQSVSVALPDSVPAIEIADVEVRADHDVWIARLDAADAAVTLYEKVDGAAWTSTALHPDWSKTDLDGIGATAVTFVGTTDNSLAVDVTAQATPSTGNSILFVAAAAGDAFTPISFLGVNACSGLIWHSLVLLSPTEMVVVAGPAFDRTCISEDGGRTWRQQTLSGVPNDATDRLFGTPLRVGSGEMFPLFTDDAAGNEDITLMAVGPDGNLISSPDFATLIVTPDGGWVPVGSSGNTVWVAFEGIHAVFSSAAGQGAWTRIDAPTLPASVMTIAVSDEMHADIIAVEDGCVPYTPNCHSWTSHYTTGDGGRTWTLTAP